MAMQVKLTFLIYLLFILSQAFADNGTCVTITNDGSSTQKYCCDFFEKIKYGCVACVGGFESFRGSPCKPCSRNTYGIRCVHQCFCMTNQRCDHLYGCVDIITTVGHSTVLTSVTENEGSNEKKHRDIPSDKKIYVYIFGGGLAFTLMLLCICYKIRRYMSSYIVNSQVQETNRISESHRFESVYDEIDELALDDMNQQSNRNSCSVENESSRSSGTTKSITSNNEGYLHPYQPIIHNTDNPTYSFTSDAVTFTEKKSEDHICEEMSNETYVNVEQDKNTIMSLIYSDSQSLNYSGISINANLLAVDLDRYENTRIF